MSKESPPETPATTPADVIGFWFKTLTPKEWYANDPAVDAKVEKTLRPLTDDALSGRLSDWTGTAEGALALIILLDQGPRNIWRGTPRAFAGDAAALALARRMVETGQDLEIAQNRRSLVYHPFQHAEDLAAQEEGVVLCAERLPPADTTAHHARRHRDVIAQFGRFPHRNAVLGRTPTEEEAAFLAAGGARFGTADPAENGA